ncbi:thioredoxin family protein [Salegentibacter chungangensis]|uniref:Thioredoxin family protein n=1 Tax=Salegentibacter chungangensis TaxID=1335724 RepID=A0ABW3NQ28_9FLAO
MHKLLLIFLALALGGNSDKTKEISKTTTGTKIQTDMLIGEFEPEELKEEPYAGWFNSVYDDYTPEEKALQTIDENISDYEITVFMGTWCGDSKRETPKLLKILEETGYDMDKFTIIGVNHSKSTPGNMEEEFQVHRVPTIIFSKNGKEVNRFVEYAQQSLAKDIAKIVSGKDYSNSYAK